MILFVFLIGGSVSADTLGGLLLNLRERVGEPDTNSSFFSDATGNRWINLGAASIWRLSQSGHRDSVFRYHPDTNVFNLPATPAIRSVHAQVGTRWYDITDDPQALELSVVRSDSVTLAFWDKIGGIDSVFTDTTDCTDACDSTTANGSTVQYTRVYLRVGGFVPRSTDIAFSEDAATYKLPSDFRRTQGMIVRSNGEWTQAIEIPLFSVDTNYTSYFVAQPHVDTNLLYVRTQDLVDDDTMRVFYWAGPISGDSVRISYYTQFVPMSADSVECLLDDNLENLAVEEAVRYYYDALRNETGSQLMLQSTRSDLRSAP